MPDEAFSGDWQYALLLNADGSMIPNSPRMWTRSNARSWQTATLDLTAYRGKTLQLTFGTLNDGDGRSAAMYVDDVVADHLLAGHPYADAISSSTASPSSTITPSPTTTPSSTPTPERSHRVYLPLALKAAPTPSPTTTSSSTPTPTATGTATRTPTPTSTLTPSVACYEGIANGGFETNEAWIIRSNPALAAYVTSPVHGGLRSMRTGIAAGGTNVGSYSPIEQQLTFPALPLPGTASTIRLSFWRYNIYDEGGSLTSLRASSDPASLPRTEAQMAEAPLGADLFYVIAIRQDGTIDWLFTEQVHAPTWRQTSVDLSGYAGETIRLQFGTYNDGAGGVSRTYVDDVSIEICPPPESLVLPAGWARRIIGRPEMSTIYADVGGLLYRSGDAGRHWRLAGTARPEQTILSADPNVLYAGDGYPCYAGGDAVPMWQTIDGGVSWHTLPAGLNLKPLAAHPTDHRLYAAGCNGPYLSTDAGASFSHQPDPLFGIYDVKSIAPVGSVWSETWVGGVSEGGGGAALVTRDGGAHWARSYPQVVEQEIGWLGEITLDRFVPGQIYLPALYGFYYTPDDGATWITNSQGLGDVIGGGYPSGLNALAQPPGDSGRRLYLGTARGLYTRDPATSVWSKITGHLYDQAIVQELLVLDGMPDWLYVTTSSGVFVYDMGLVPPGPTLTPTRTPSPAATPTQTNTPGPSPTSTLTRTPSPTPTASRTPSPTPTATRTPSRTPTSTCTPTLTSSPTATVSAVPTAPAEVWPTPYVLASLALPVGSHPHGIALKADGSRAYVAFHGPEHTGRSLGILGTSPLSLLSQLTLGSGELGPNGVAVIEPSGLVVVANRQTANASVANANATPPSLVGQIPADLLPDGVIVQGGHGYVANFGSDTVTMFDPLTLAVSGELHVGHEPALFAGDPSSGDVYLSLHGSNEVLRINAGTPVHTYGGIVAPYGVAFDPVSRRLYVANRGGAHTVTVVDVASGQTVGTIALDREPYVLAVNPRTGHLHVACGDQVKIFRTLDWALVATIPVPPGAEEGIAVDDARNLVYVTSGDGDAVTVIRDVSPPLVLFASDRDGNGELYHMLPDGREQSRLTYTGDASEVMPAGSPDGRWIAYVRTGADGWRHLWLMSRDGRNPQQLTFGGWEDLRPTWSGDGSRLAFASNRDGQWDIYTLTLANRVITRLTSDPAEDTNPDWAWSTGRIAFQSTRNSPNGEIWSMAADGTDVRRLTTNFNGDRGPSWSPAGDYIAFWGSRAEQTLYRMRADGSDLMPLVSRLLRPEAPAWGPGSAGGWIVFSGYRPDSGYSEILRMTSSGAGLALLTFNEVNFDYSPGWLPGQ